MDAVGMMRILPLSRGAIDVRYHDLEYEVLWVPIIRVQMEIQSPIERVFDLCRSVEVHLKSTPYTYEKAVGGVTSGLLGLGDTVTWEATHLGVRQRLTSHITVCNTPHFFQDRMLSGAFEGFTHDHCFDTSGNTTKVEDRFEFESPFGYAGELINYFFLIEYMRQFLERRLYIVKGIAESEEWKKYLNH